MWMSGDMQITMNIEANTGNNLQECKFYAILFGILPLFQYLCN